MSREILSASSSTNHLLSFIFQIDYLISLHEKHQVQNYTAVRKHFNLFFIIIPVLRFLFHACRK
jgi:hypothetical protein